MDTMTTLDQTTEALLVFSFRFADMAATEAGARAVEEYLSQIASIRQPDVTPEQARFTGLEIIAAIGTATVIAHNTHLLLVEVQRIIADLQQIGHQLGILEMHATIDGRSVDELDDEVLERHVGRRRARARRSAT